MHLPWEVIGLHFSLVVLGVCSVTALSNSSVAHLTTVCNLHPGTPKEPRKPQLFTFGLLSPFLRSFPCCNAPHSTLVLSKGGWEQEPESKPSHPHHSHVLYSAALLFLQIHLEPALWPGTFCCDVENLILGFNSLCLVTHTSRTSFCCGFTKGTQIFPLVSTAVIICGSLIPQGGHISFRKRQWCDYEFHTNRSCVTHPL